MTGSSRLFARAVARLVGLLLAANLLAACGRAPPPPSQPLDHQVYVWQRVWTPEVLAAIEAAPAQVQTFRLLVAELDPAETWQEFRAGRPGFLQEHDPAAARLKGAIAVIRVSGQRGIESHVVQEQLASWIAAQRPEDWAGLEIDYDCPTARLPEYARILSRLRGTLPQGWQLSVTALPAWIGDRGLQQVLASVDSSVLQVHSVMRPQFGLFQAGLAIRWANDYSRVSPHPFRIALPTYGSQVVWRKDGTVLNVQSEEPSGTRETPGAITEEWMARPAEVARALAELQRRRPARLAGFVWFRLPVEGDRRSWSRSTWQSLLQGSPMHADMVPSVRATPAGVRWLELGNDGPTDGAFVGAFRQAGNCLAVDALHPFQLERENGDVYWRTTTALWLHSREKVRVGWTRCPEDIVMVPAPASELASPHHREGTR